MLTGKDVDDLQSIQQSAADIQRHVVNMLVKNRVGRDWQRDMTHAADRIRELTERLGK